MTKKIRKTAKKNTILELVARQVGMDIDNMVDTSFKTLFLAGITPDDYKEYYDDLKKGEMKNAQLYVDNSLFGDDIPEDENLSAFDSMFPMGLLQERERDRSPLMAFPVPGAAQRTLLLKIQLKDVKKPPLWREVEIPGDFNFLQLHRVIQIVMGWGGGHLWMFQKSPHDRGFTIGMSRNTRPEFDMDDCTNEADDTPLTAFFKNVGDKICYTYDFGDDWIHEVTLKKIEERKSDFPVCVKFKSDNPLEDCGGLWGFEQFRDMYKNADTYTAGKWKELLKGYWWDSKRDFMLFMEEHVFDISYVNHELSSVKRP